MILWLVLFVAGALALMMMRAGAWTWLVAELAWIWIGGMTDQANAVACVLLAILLCVPTLLVAIKSVRQTLITRPALDIFRKILPGMSATERDAIEAGTVWWDAELFPASPAGTS